MDTQAKPTPLQPRWDAIPDELRQKQSWLLWRYEFKNERWTKPPRRASGSGYASTTDSGTWASFEAARQAAIRADSRADGIGLVLVEDLVGVDLDHVLDGAGEIESWAVAILGRFAGCYVERSPGGDGIRIFCRGTASRSGKGGPANRLEVYDRQSPRYLTVTGHRMGDGEVIEAQKALDWLHAAHMAKPKQDAHARQVPGNGLSDGDIIDRAGAAKNGAKFRALYFNGSGDSEDDSSNDMALANILAFWTRNEAQIDRLFRRSALMREKWDSRRGDFTYGDITIRNALATVTESFDQARRQSAPAGGPQRQASEDSRPIAATPSEDAVALAFVSKHDIYRFVAPWHQWLRWDGKRWAKDRTGNVYQAIRNLVRELVGGTKAERNTANASFVSGVERMLRTDPSIAVLPEQLDADPWALNTQSGIVDLGTGDQRAHNPADLCTRIANAAVDPSQGSDLWDSFLTDITLGDVALATYLQRLAGYCATGVTTEDVLAYLFGLGANGKSSFAEALGHVLGDYAKTFAAEVLMEAKGERHPTELAQFVGVRLALTSEPASNAVWNDSRIKSLTGDATISARVMRGDPFEFNRSHKMLVIGNHMPRLSEVTHAIRRRVQMVPFRAVFTPGPGPTMRDRLKAEASGAILAWVIDGARLWVAEGTAPPVCVRGLSAEYLGDQDLVGQWLEERCEQGPKVSQLSGELYRSYSSWCEGQGARPKSNVALSAHLVSAGFTKRATMVGKVFSGLRLKVAI